MIARDWIYILLFVFCFFQVESSRRRPRKPWINADIKDLEDVCLTKECVVTAATILKHLDTSVDPCQDFYQFACGGFHKNHLDLHNSWNIDDLLENSMREQLRRLLRKPKIRLDKINHKMKDYFDSCTNVVRIKKLGLLPLRELLDSHGGWPSVSGSSWNVNKFSWMNFTSNIIHDGLTLHLHSITPLDFILAPNHGQFRSESHYIPGVKVGTFDTIRYNASTIKDNSIYQLSVELAVLLGASRQIATEEMEEVFLFQEKLIQLTEMETDLPDSDICQSDAKYGSYRSGLVNATTVKTLYKITNKIDWLPLMQHALSPSLTMETECFCLGETQTIQRVVDFVEESSPKTVANFMLSKLALTYVDFVMDKRWSEILGRILKWGSSFRHRFNWKICLTDLDSYMYHQLLSLYVRNYFRPGDKENMRMIFLLVQEQFYKLLDETRWLNYKTLDKTKERLMDLLPFLGYPEEILNDRKMEKYYKHLLIKPDEYFKNLLRLQKFKYQKFCEDIGKPLIRTHWSHPLSLLLSNAYYNPTLHVIDIPVSHARGMYFTTNRPEVLNFGSLGSIIGHEITHGLNPIGLNQYPTVGLTANWWTDEDSEAFNERARCTVNQYENYGYEGLGKINGNLTLDENLADNVGVKVAYKAYKRWRDLYGPVEARLPGLSFTPNQLFWLAYANSWCESYPITRNDDEYQVHSWPKFRVIGSVSNSEEFSVDFKCTSNAPMNPAKKCVVW